MPATGTAPLEPPEGAAGQFVRGFACSPDANGKSHSPEAPGAPDHAGEPGPEFRLTTVGPGLAVEVELGGFTRHW